MALCWGRGGCAKTRPGHPAQGIVGRCRLHATMPISVRIRSPRTGCRRALADSVYPSIHSLNGVEMDELLRTGLSREQIANWRGLYRSRMKLKSVKPHYVDPRADPHPFPDVVAS